MLTRRVFLTVKDPNGEIVGLCGDCGLTSKTTAVRELLTGVCRYYVKLDGEYLDVRTTRAEGGYTLTASLHGTQSNILSQLPDG